MSNLKNISVNPSVMASKAVKGLANTPNKQKPIGNSLSAEQLKDRFDAQAEYVASKLNEVVAVADTELDNKLDKKPDGTNALIGEDNKITTSYLPQSLIGKMVYGGTFDAEGIITASEKASNLNGVNIDGITVADYESFYFVASGTHILKDGIEEDAQVIATFENGDMAICNGNSTPKWSKIDNTDEVQTVNGKKGAVVLLADDVGALATDGDSKDCTATFTEAETLANIATGETHATLFGKIKKAISSLFSHTASTANPHSVTKTQVGLDNVDNLKQVATTTDQDISGNKKFLDTVFADSIKGKNLFNINGDINTRYNGTIISLNSVSNNVLTSNINGSTSYSAGQFINVEIGKEYTISFVGIDIGSGIGGGVYIYNRDNSTAIASKTFNASNLNTIRALTFIPTEDEILIAFATSGGTGAQFTDIMFNLGAVATAYTPYIGAFVDEKALAEKDYVDNTTLTAKGYVTPTSLASYLTTNSYLKKGTSQFDDTLNPWSYGTSGSITLEADCTYQIHTSNSEYQGILYNPGAGTQTVLIGTYIENNITYATTFQCRQNILSLYDHTTQNTTRAIYYRKI